MPGIKMRIDGITSLEKELQRLNSVRFDAVEKKQLTQLLNRARQPGGTPVDSGEMRDGSSVTGEEMGYISEYSPHVEYGHRTIDGGYVPGQHFLQNNVDIQRPIYREDLLKAIRKE